MKPNKGAARGQNPQKNKKKGEATKKKRKPRTAYVQYDLKDAEQFSLCDAMRYDRRYYGCFKNVSNEEIVIFEHSRSDADQRHQSTRFI